MLVQTKLTDLDTATQTDYAAFCDAMITLEDYEIPESRVGFVTDATHVLQMLHDNRWNSVSVTTYNYWYDFSNPDLYPDYATAKKVQAVTFELWFPDSTEVEFFFLSNAMWEQIKAHFDEGETNGTPSGEVTFYYLKNHKYSRESLVPSK